MKSATKSKEYSFLLEKYNPTPSFISREASITKLSNSDISFWTPLNSSVHTDYHRPDCIEKPHHPSE